MMKKIYSIHFSILSAFAAVLFTVSCTKEIPVSGNPLPAARTVTATFEPAGTKTTLGADDRPLWSPGDMLRILSSSNYENVTLAEENIVGSKVTFTLVKSHTGTLRAVYPASATAMENCTDGALILIVPTIQDGTFASANICVAQGDDRDHLVFSNATAVLEFSQEAASTGVTDIRISAANPLAGSLKVTFDTDRKAVVTEEHLTGKTIRTEPAATAAGKYYIAVAPVETGAVTITCHTPLQEVSCGKDSKNLSRNKLYPLTIPATGFADRYVTIAGKKWAKCNVGADSPSDAGWYFAWGYAKGCIRNVNNNGWVLASDNLTLKNFNADSSNFPYRDASTFEDAANAHWGGGWHIPDSEDFVSLCAACFAEWDENAKGLRFYTAKNEADKGLLHLPGSWKEWSAEGEYKVSSKSSTTSTYDISTDASLFFPAAGYGDGANKSADGNDDSSGFYWSRDIVSGTADKAFDFYFNKQYSVPMDNQGGARCLGYTVRPVAE